MRRATFALCLALLLASGIGAQSKRRSTAPRKSSKQLQRDLSRIRNQKSAIRRELRQTKKQAKVVVEDLHRVDRKLVDVSGRLEQTSSRLEQGKQEQGRLGHELEDATKRLDVTREEVRKRLRQMYMEGAGSALSVLVGTRSAGDLASRKFLMESIARKDRELFSRYKELRGTVARQKMRQDQLVVEVATLKRNQQAQKVELAGVREEKGEVLQSLRARQGELQRLLAQIESDERLIAAQIRAARRRSGPPLPAFTGRFSRPVNARITSGFGMRFHPILKVRRLHAGVDFGASSGTPIHAAAAGRVISATYMRGFGNVVILDHGSDTSTVYAHCSRIYVSAGQKVARGQRIAAVGATGLATGPHLHWEVRINGRPVNPVGR